MNLSIPQIQLFQIKSWQQNEFPSTFLLKLLRLLDYPNWSLFLCFYNLSVHSPFYSQNSLYIKNTCSKVTTNDTPYFWDKTQTLKTWDIRIIRQSLYLTVSSPIILPAPSPHNLNVESNIAQLYYQFPKVLIPSLGYEHHIMFPHTNPS